MPIIETIQIGGVDDAAKKLEGLGQAGAGAFIKIGSAAEGASEDISSIIANLDKLRDAFQSAFGGSTPVLGAEAVAKSIEQPRAEVADAATVADLPNASEPAVLSEAGSLGDGSGRPIPVEVVNFPAAGETTTDAAPGEPDGEAPKVAAETAAEVVKQQEHARAPEPTLTPAVAEQHSPIVAAPEVPPPAPGLPPVASTGLLGPSYWTHAPTAASEVATAASVPGQIVAPTDHAAAPAAGPARATAPAPHGEAAGGEAPDPGLEKASAAAEKAREKLREAAHAGAEAFAGTKEAIFGVTEALSGLSAAGALTTFEGIGHTVASLVADLGKFGTVASTVVGGLTAVGAAMGGVALAGGELAHSTAEDVLGVENLARTAGASIQQVEGLKQAFSGAGVSADSIGQALKNLAIRSEAEWPQVAKSSRDAADSAERDALKINEAARGAEAAQSGERQAVIKTTEATNAVADAKDKQETSQYDVQDAQLNLLKAQQEQQIAHYGHPSGALASQIKAEEIEAKDRAVRRAELDVQAKERAATQAPLETEKAQIQQQTAVREQGGSDDKLAAAILDLSASIKAQQDNLLTNFDAVSEALKGNRRDIDLNKVSPQTFFDLALRKAGPEASGIDRLAAIADVFVKLSGQQQTAFGREAVGRGYSPEVGTVLARGGDAIRENVGKPNELGKLIEEAVAASRKAAISEEGAKDAARLDKITAGGAALPGYTAGLDKIKEVLEANQDTARKIGEGLGAAMGSMAENADKGAEAVKGLALAIGALTAASVFSGFGKYLEMAKGGTPVSGVGPGASPGTARSVAGQVGNAVVNAGIIGAADAISNTVGEQFGAFMDKHVPGAAALDNAASKIGLGKNYEEQKATEEALRPHALSPRAHAPESTLLKPEPVAPVEPLPPGARVNPYYKSTEAAEKPAPPHAPTLPVRGEPPVVISPDVVVPGTRTEPPLPPAPAPEPKKAESPDAYVPLPGAKAVQVPEPHAATDSPSLVDRVLAAINPISSASADELRREPGATGPVATDAVKAEADAAKKLDDSAAETSAAAKAETASAEQLSRAGQEITLAGQIFAASVKDEKDKPAVAPAPIVVTAPAPAKSDDEEGSKSSSGGGGGVLAAPPIAARPDDLAPTLGEQVIRSSPPTAPPPATPPESEPIPGAEVETAPPPAASRAPRYPEDVIGGTPGNPVKISVDTPYPEPPERTLPSPPPPPTGDAMTSARDYRARGYELPAETRANTRPASSKDEYIDRGYLPGTAKTQDAVSENQFHAQTPEQIYSSGNLPYSERAQLQAQVEAERKRKEEEELERKAGMVYFAEGGSVGDAVDETRAGLRVDIGAGAIGHEGVHTGAFHAPGVHVGPVDASADLPHAHGPRDASGVHISPVSIRSDDRLESDGGHITGPGTATSDSIPAMLSDGEYVVRAEAVDHIGVHALDAINEKRVDPPKLAKGGYISNITPADIRRMFDRNWHGEDAKRFSAGGLVGDTSFRMAPIVTMAHFEAGLAAQQPRMFADGGLADAIGKPGGDGDDGPQHHVHLTIGDQKFEPMLAPADVADALGRYMMDRQFARSGQAPSSKS